jgi:hypothetical protein
MVHPAASKKSRMKFIRSDLSRTSTSLRMGQIGARVSVTRPALYANFSPTMKSFSRSVNSPGKHVKNLPAEFHPLPPLVKIPWVRLCQLGLPVANMVALGVKKWSSSVITILISSEMLTILTWARIKLRIRPPLQQLFLRDHQPSHLSINLNPKRRDKRKNHLQAPTQILLQTMRIARRKRSRRTQLEALENLKKLREPFRVVLLNLKCRFNNNSLSQLFWAQIFWIY